MGHSIGIIGGADGPTAIFVFSGGPQWFSLWGLVAVILILLPNILYAFRIPGQENRCTHKPMNILEQIGRYGCMALMVFPLGAGSLWTSTLPLLFLGLAGCIVLLATYWIFWGFYFCRRTLFRATALAVIPTAIFGLFGVCNAHPLLIAAAAAFGIGHIHVTRCNARQAGI